MSATAEIGLKRVNGKKPVKLENILFATDFSPVSEAALGYALAIARRYDSKLFVAHVVRPDVFQMLPPENLAGVLEQIRRYAEQEMANLLISGRLRGVPHQVLLEQGQLWPALSGMIEKNDIDLVVVGTRGRTGVQKLLLGSVAEEIFRLSPRPVLTVGPTVSGHAPEETHLRQIVYATDFTPTAERAAAYALSLAQEHQAHLTLLHVVRDVDKVSPENIARLREFFTRRLEKVVPPETNLWCDPEFAVSFGAPAEGVLEIAKSRHADLIVLGVRGVASFAGHLPPATAYKIVCQAPCPVLTVRG
jgi:nucleotide-binding universal stress UspA family protein